LKGRRDTNDPAVPVISKRDDAIDSDVGLPLICAPLYSDADISECSFSVSSGSSTRVQVVENDPPPRLNIRWIDPFFQDGILLCARTAAGVPE
jgi:hypothetical protein